MSCLKFGEDTLFSYLLFKRVKGDIAITNQTIHSAQSVGGATKHTSLIGS